MSSTGLAALLAVALVVLIGAASGCASTATRSASGLQNVAQLGETSFVAEYGSRYSDTKSAYNAVLGYVENGNSAVLMTNDYIANYKKSTQDTTSSLGFERYSIPAGTKMDHAAFIVIFNQYFAKELARYMNALAQNPTPEGRAIVDSQFAEFCLNTDANDSNLDSEFSRLVKTAQGVVEKYGSAANYNVAPGSTNPDDHSTWFSDAGYFKSEGEDFWDLADVVFDVDVYKGVGSTRSEELIRAFGIVIAQPAHAQHVSIGQYGTTAGGTTYAPGTAPPSNP